MNVENKALSPEQVTWATQQAHTLKETIKSVMVGQHAVVHDVLTVLLAGGHALIEGVPGLGKTLLARALTQTLTGSYKRVQFTADLMPADISGHALFDFKNQTFTVRQGPIFCNFLLADEINRAPAKTQSSLLEAMQERQVTIDGTSYALPQPFMVLATQNPIEQDGTYPLPLAQMDRFLAKILIDYPTVDEEAELITRMVDGLSADLNVSNLPKVMSLEDLQAVQYCVAQIPCDVQVVQYMVAIARATRDFVGIESGAGPRASIALLQCARARAVLSGHAFVTPDDVKSCATMVLRHRLRLTAEFEIEGRQVDEVIAQLLDGVPAPRQ